MLQIGTKVRPRGEGIARSHIGSVVAILRESTCPTCGTTKPARVEVLWPGGRTGEWSVGTLEEVTDDATQ